MYVWINEQIKDGWESVYFRVPNPWAMDWYLLGTGLHSRRSATGGQSMPFVPHCSPLLAILPESSLPIPPPPPWSMEKLSSTKSVLPECQCVWGPVLAFTLVRWELPEGFEKRHEKA